MKRFFKLAQILSNSKPTLYFLIGLPASGKTGWVERSNLKGSAVVINRDDIVKVKAKELKVGAGTYDDMFPQLSQDIVPPGIPPKEVWADPAKSDEVDKYYEILKQAAKNFNTDPKNKDQIRAYGSLIPYSKNLLTDIIVKYGRSVASLIPFTFKKIFDANKKVDQTVKDNLQMAVDNKKDIIIDMMSLNKGSRDGQRRKIVSFIEGVSEEDANPNDISKYYNQTAIVFVPESGYTPEIIGKIKSVNELRRIEEEARGERKTIPDRVFDTKYEPPLPSENFSKIEYVGPTSLAKLTEKRASSLRSLFMKALI